MDDQSFEVIFVPAATEPKWLKGRAVVVVDVLRATSTIASALAAGAECIHPMPDLDSAREAHQRLGEESRLGGERGGQKVDGFHCGNSPREYTREIIGGRQLVLATTNGTVAMESCRQASLILTGAFTNLSAIARRLEEEPEVTILCSGTDKRITGEDVLFGGAIASVLKESAAKRGIKFKTNDSATIAMAYWDHVNRGIDAGTQTLADAFRNAHGGVNLVRNGYDADVEFAARIDVQDIVPVLDPATWTIRAKV